jgi:2,3-dihydroxy-p-cumate/2,3-dihydroxybenzoate 3,4-dioxygenase
MHLRSIELQMPDRVGAVAFLKEPWGLIEVETRGQTTFMRGTAAQHYAVALTEGPARAFLSATITGSREEIDAIWARVESSGLRHGPWVDEFDEPGRGAGFYVAGPNGEPYRFIAEAEPAPEALPTDRLHPLRVAHVVFNTGDREAATSVLTDIFGFTLSDRTAYMNFLRCDDLHHVVAYANAPKATLNHIAFEMKDTDAVLRGMGRLKDAGCETVWGAGRHGPGDNVFAYFVGPFGACIEYTAEIQRVDESYVPGTPETWKFPNGRNDQWGIFSRDSEKMAASGDSFPYQPIAVAA